MSTHLQRHQCLAIECLTDTQSPLYIALYC
jgi:hypothetical protein